jgi:RNA polymerase-binding transcription factor DksA
MDPTRDLADRDPSADPTPEPTTERSVAEAPSLDLAAIEADLAAVDVALARLDAGTYWTCEVTGQPLPEDLMVAEPTRRRLPTG